MRHRNPIVFVLLALVLMACGSSEPNQGSGAPNIVLFTANPTTISPGSSASLTWAVDGEAELAISQGVGKVYGSSGTVTVTPNATTSYILTARNQSGSDALSVSVTVSASAAPTPPGEGSPPTTPDPPSDPAPPVEPSPPTTPDPPSDPTPPDAPADPGTPTSPPTDSEEGAQNVLGRWTFEYEIGGSSFTDTFTLDEVLELLPDDFIASGENQFGGLVIGGYDFEFASSYYIFDGSPNEYTGIDQNFDFQFTGPDTVAGEMYFYDRFTGEFSSDIPFIGSRN